MAVSCKTLGAELRLRSRGLFRREGACERLVPARETGLAPLTVEVDLVYLGCERRRKTSSEAFEEILRVPGVEGQRLTTWEFLVELFDRLRVVAPTGWRVL